MTEVITEVITEARKGAIIEASSEVIIEAITKEEMKEMTVLDASNLPKRIGILIIDLQVDPNGMVKGIFKHEDQGITERNLYFV